VIDTPREYDDLAQDYSERTYADEKHMYERRLRLVRDLGTPLLPPDRVLDLGCGDAAFGPYVLGAGFEYRGVDRSRGMVEVAAARVGTDRVELADFTTYRPPSDVAAAACFGAVKYVEDLAAFFGLVAEYTTKKVVFNVVPREQSLEEVRGAALGAGFATFETRPFFIPQSRRLPRAAAVALEVAERIRPVADRLLRSRFTVVCAASRA
jgi:predicted TPR repeat methyltransferase